MLGPDALSCTSWAPTHRGTTASSQRRTGFHDKLLLRRIRHQKSKSYTSSVTCPFVLDARSAYELRRATLITNQQCDKQPLLQADESFLIDKGTKRADNDRYYRVSMSLLRWPALASRRRKASVTNLLPCCDASCLSSADLKEYYRPTSRRASED